MYITLTGFNNYYKLKPFAIGNIVMCVKEQNNPYDSDAIKAMLPLIGTVAYVANSVDTVAGGTLSASRIYDKVGDRFFVKVRFTTYTKVICEIIEGDEKEIEEQMQAQFTMM
ncbi:MAG: DNA-binding protein [Clostridia bacterium]|nr:DNA-binding protein [Clostridia bacterium]MBQ6933701.1 DNA-binding protein [Clostridia bacterium]MBQ7087154.1 DNA-binding protein [Clostridia bacterium]MBQ7094731.1 DNA-binding protein [Clostridia bacterium]